MSKGSRRSARGGSSRRGFAFGFLTTLVAVTVVGAAPPRALTLPPRQELTPAGMESLPPLRPLDHGRNFLAGGRIEGMNEARICSTLGDQARPLPLDRDHFVFEGTTGEEIVLRLEASGSTNSGTHASLVLADQIRDVQFFRADHSALPNALRVRLPATGRYVVAVGQHQGTARETAFVGRYCLTLRSSGGAASTLRPTDSVEGAENAPPVADAGTDQTVEDSDGNGSEPVQLDGTNSRDADGRIVSYAWSENGKTIAEGARPRVTFTVGRHNVILTVTDDDGARDDDDVVVTVERRTAECAADGDCPEDGNLCTDARCADGRCEQVPFDVSECDDADPCTIDACDAGAGCTHTLPDCDDGLFCNGEEYCDDAECISSGDPCPAGQVCDESRDTCVECLTGADCADTDPCTTDRCVKDRCVHEPTPGCCRLNSDCNDGTLCTLDRCINNVCSNPPRNCSDNNACTVDTCSSVTGCVHTPISCDDGNACTDDSCDRTLGCRHAPHTDACDDGDDCTFGDQCANGVCAGQSFDCDDGLFCTGVETCHDGDCVSSGNPCEDGQFCDEENGCTNMAVSSKLRSETTTTSTVSEGGRGGRSGTSSTASTSSTRESKK